MLRDYVDSYWMDKTGNTREDMDYADMSRQELSEVLAVTQKELARVESGAGNTGLSRQSVN